MNTQLADLFMKFLKDPSQDNFLPLRRLVITDPSYHPALGLADKVVDLHAEQRMPEVLAQPESSLPTLLLSPRAHFAAGLALKQLGRDVEENTQRHIVHCLLEAILASGEGSKESPYLVTNISDEDDLMSYLGWQSSGSKKTVWAEGEPAYDVLTCKDGREVWFDVSPVVVAIGREAVPAEPSRRSSAETQTNPLEGLADNNPVYDPEVQRLTTQMAGVLLEQIKPADWDRAECLIQATSEGLHYTVTRAGDPSANLNVNLPFHRLAQQLHHYWQQRWGQPLPPVRVEMSPKPEGGWQAGFFIASGDAPGAASSR